MTSDIPLFEIDWDIQDIKNVVDAIGRGKYWAKGPYVSEFEKRLAEYHGVNHAVVVNSGTTALVTALESLGIGQGDEVIVPPFTFIATANVVEIVGATPVFADIERKTYGLDPTAVQNNITDDTAAILPVHIYGSVCQIDELRRIASKNDLPLIEDAAAALGAKLYGEQSMTFGDVAATSFCQNKIITTGEGGAVLTDDSSIAESARLYQSHGRVAADGYFESPGSGTYAAVGSNYRMSDISAALGCAQLGRVSELVENRRAAASRMTAAFADLDGVTPHTGHPDGRHVYQIYAITLDERLDRRRIIEGLDERGIASKVYWDPIHLSEYYRDTYSYGTGDFPIAEDVASRVLSLPMHPNLSEEETDRIVKAVSDLIAE